MRNRFGRAVSQHRTRPATLGSIMPLVALSLLLLTVVVFGTARTYHDHAKLYHLTRQHYQAQTLLAYSETVLKQQTVPEVETISSLTFTWGTVRIEPTADDRYRLSVVIDEGTYTEDKVISLTRQR